MKHEQTFTPNWESKTTRNRLLAIESYAQSRFFKLEPIRIHRNELAKAFGQAQNPLSKFFQENLLQKTSEPIAGVRFTEHYFSWSNLLWSFLQAGLVTSEEVGQVIDKKFIPSSMKEINKEKISSSRKRSGFESLSVLVFSDDIKAKEFFDNRFFLNSNLLNQNAEYKEDETTSRLLSDFQRKPKKVVAQFFAGWWNVDVNACFYTLFHQHMINNVLPWWGKTNDTYPAIEAAYKHKDKFRQIIADDLGVDLDSAKMILAALAFGCKWVNTHHSNINKNLLKAGYDPHEVYPRFKSSKLAQALLADLRRAWPKAMSYWQNQNGKSARKIYFVEVTSKKTGEITKRFKPASFRSRIYFELERKVLDVSRDFHSGSICHLMHDGFITKSKPDLDRLVSVIKERTGFNVTFSCEQY